MAPSYQLSKHAESDLAGIARYTAENWGIEQMNVYEAAFVRALNAIVVSPTLIGSKSRDDLVKDCRSYRVEHHYVFYRESDGVIQVGRILHEKMNFERHVSEDSFER